MSQEFLLLTEKNAYDILLQTKKWQFLVTLDTQRHNFTGYILSLQQKILGDTVADLATKLSGL